MVTEISHTDVGVTGDDSARGGCRSDLVKGSAGILRLIMGEWIDLPDPWLEVS